MMCLFLSRLKHIQTIIFLFFSIFCIGQKQSNSYAEYNLSITYRPATIQILMDTTILSTHTVNNTMKITYTDIKTGVYKIRISGQGQETVIRDSIIVSKRQQLVLKFHVDGPCLFDHPIDYIPTCPKNHSDSIISIVYGLSPTRGDTFIKDNKDMKVKYGGCGMTGCDPHFYCKLHDIEF